jgi:hypothetical protein
MVIGSSFPQFPDDPIKLLHIFVIDLLNFFLVSGLVLLRLSTHASYLLNEKLLHIRCGAFKGYMRNFRA